MNAACVKPRCVFIDSSMPRRFDLAMFASVTGLLLMPGLSWSQFAPDAGAIMRETDQLRRPQVPQLSPRAVPEAPIKPDADALQFVVKRFNLTGVTLVPIAEVQAVLEPWTNREITFEDLERALAALSAYYQSKGWYVRPQLPAQDIVDGTVTINVIEGRLGQVEQEQSDDPPLSSERVEAFLTARQAPGAPLNMDDLSRAVTVLNEQPGVSAQVALAPSQDPGASDVIVSTTRLAALSGTLQADNWGARSTGYYRGTANANWNNPLGIGDQFQANLMGSEGTQYARVAYNLPVGYDGWRANVSYSALQYRLLGEFATLNNTGWAQTVNLGLTYPLVRRTTQNVNLSISASNSEYSNKYSIEQEKLNIDRRVTLGAVSLTGDLADDWWGGGFNLWGLTATSGYSNLAGTRANKIADRVGANTQGTFATLGGNGARLQRLTQDASLWLSFSGQWASQNLDSSQRFSLGGPQGVRAYPIYEGTGDQGWLGTIEGRYNVSAQAQASLFYDMGWIQQFKSTSHLTQMLGPNTYNLKGWGASVSYNHNNVVSLRFTVASRIGGNPNANPITGADGDGTNDRTRFWFNVTVNL
jgi:hemolysin activation/secretion protein